VGRWEQLVETANQKCGFDFCCWLLKLPGLVLLQVVSVTNIAQPTTRQFNHPRMLCLQLTDGHTKCQAIEYKHMNSLSLDTPPGAKLLLSAVVVKSGQILLEPSNTTLVEGTVLSLYNSWNKKKELVAKKAELTDGEDPPPVFQVGVSQVSFIESFTFVTLMSPVHLLLSGR
jgi:hypothetical protein